MPRQLLSQVKVSLLAVPFLRNLNILRREPLQLIYKYDDLRDDYYEKIKDCGDIELEHQIGRLRNYKKILTEISEAGFDGDIIEFGSWRGFTLLWIAYLMERIPLHKKIIGLDGFIGLPNSDGVFQKGAFDDTSLQLCRRNIWYHDALYAHTKKQIFIEQCLYDEKDRILEILNRIGSQKFCFIHIDCDISSSAEDVFRILDAGLLADTCYLLFDDYGHESALRSTVDAYISRMQTAWHIEVHSQTHYTKNFKFQRRTS